MRTLVVHQYYRDRGGLETYLRSTINATIIYIPFPHGTTSHVDDGSFNGIM